MGIVPSTFASYAPGMYGWNLIKATLAHTDLCIDDGAGIPLVKVPGTLVSKPAPGLYSCGLWEWNFSSHYPRVMSELNIVRVCIAAAMHTPVGVRERERRLCVRTVTHPQHACMPIPHILNTRNGSLI